MSDRSAGLERMLVEAVQDLAASGAAAVGRKPEGSHQPDGLALDFDAAYTAFVDGLDELPSMERLQALQSLDSELSAMSGKHNAQLWTEDAVRTHPRWAKVRALATDVLERFGWPRSPSS